MKKITSIALILIMMGISARASLAERVRVSVILSSQIGPFQEASKGFQEFFRKSGVEVSVSEYNLQYQKPEEVSEKVNREKPDLVFTVGTRASALAKERILNIPSVFCLVLYPKEILHGDSTGISMEIPPDAQLSEIKRIIPGAKRIGILYSPGMAAHYTQIARACREAGLEPVGARIESANEFSATLEKISRQIDCFLMISDSKIYFTQSVKYLLLESFRKKFPVVGLSAAYAKAGALLSLDCDYEDIGQQSGEIALKIIRGKRPDTIPLSAPRKIRLSLNLITAESMGIEIPPRTIKEAGEVFTR